eukprot:scaffold1052_cov339-Pavlova_lutheri.AAC.34
MKDGSQVEYHQTRHEPSPHHHRHSRPAPFVCSLLLRKRTIEACLSVVDRLTKSVAWERNGEVPIDGQVEAKEHEEARNEEMDNGTEATLLKVPQLDLSVLKMQDEDKGARASSAGVCA